MREPAIGDRGEFPQLVRRERIPGKHRQYAGGEFGIGQPGKAGNGGGNPGHLVRYIEAAILGETGKQHLRERAGQGRSASVAGTEIAHDADPVSIPETYRRVPALATGASAP